MNVVSGQVTVGDSQGNTTVVPFQFEVEGSTPTEVDREVTGYEPNGFTVPTGQVWEIKGLVETPKNVVVEGTLRMRPGAALRFVNVNEAAFTGGGMDPIASDVGLWVMGDGILDASGTPKVAWNRIGDDPTWLPDDELVIAPTGVGDFGSNGFERFTKGASVPQAYPEVPPAEVLDLTRDVIIEGTPSGRSHIFIRSTQPQTIQGILLRYLGPRKNGLKIVGRWPLHFHHMGDAARGSLVESVVVRDSGSHAFVCHASHGVTLRDCIAYNNQEPPFWWDNDVAMDATFDALWEHCVAALVSVGDSPYAGTNGFTFPNGHGNRAIDCVAVGVQGNASASGFHWLSKAHDGEWMLEDCVAHNNKADGIYSWQNTENGDDTLRFVAYRNGNSGIEHGAYGNPHRYFDCIAIGNGGSQGGGAACLIQFAQSKERAPEQLSHVRATLDGGGVSRIGVEFRHSPTGGPRPVLLEECTIRDVQTPILLNNGITSAYTVDLVRCTVSGRDITPIDIVVAETSPGTILRFIRLDGSAWAYEVTSSGPSVRDIPPFA